MFTKKDINLVKLIFQPYILNVIVKTKFSFTKFTLFLVKPENDKASGYTLYYKVLCPKFITSY